SLDCHAAPRLAMTRCNIQSNETGGKVKVFLNKKKGRKTRRALGSGEFYHVRALMLALPGKAPLQIGGVDSCNGYGVEADQESQKFR
ncbi:MAG: hypothetical protein LBJ96_02555, partial [Holosporaceae bacterium]|nr:hypothetical protein [Holosporaceae bacterium]